jgi:serine/threonine-protein kinase/endoribonuclease IRE1
MFRPIFLPDPKDGSLYLFGPETEALKKLPFTIPQLVASSPCRSSDGILYTGRKIDTWFSVDPQTGKREQLLGFTAADNTCPIDTQNVIFVGRTEYNIIMIDSKRKDRKWNVTFYDYSAAKMDPELVEDYDLVHFTGTSTGQVVTVDRFGNILWDINLGSPVIAVYTISKDGLLTMPFTSVADTTLSHLLKKISVKPSEFQFL